MLLEIADVLDPATCRALRDEIAAADWVDGNTTSGAGAALAKRNRQLPEDGAVATRARSVVEQALAGNALFLGAALPRRIYPPLFNRYGAGELFGAHVDNAIRVHPATGAQLRTDVSATLFLTDPADYDGGELVMEGSFGTTRHKLSAGSLLLYPSTSLHRVEPVTRGERISAFFWVESLIADAAERSILFDLDQSIQRLAAAQGLEDPTVLQLTGVYHNLVRRFSRG